MVSLGDDSDPNVDECSLKLWDMKTFREYRGSDFGLTDFRYLSGDYDEFKGEVSFASGAYVMVGDLREGSSPFAEMGGLHGTVTATAISKQFVAGGECLVGQRGGGRCTSGSVSVWDRSRHREVNVDDPTQNDDAGSYGPFINAPKLLSLARSEEARLAVNVGDRKIDVFDLSTRFKLSLTMRDNVTSMAFLPPDSDRLVARSANGDLKVWDLKVSGWRERACQIANRNLTRWEWEEVFHLSKAYEKTCPNLPDGGQSSSNDSGTDSSTHEEAPP